MTFVVATGLDLGNADSYVSLAAVDSYFEDMEDTAWDSVNEDKKLWLLRRASTVINQRYRWLDPTAYTTVPRAVEIATFELAKAWSTSSTVLQTPNVKRVSVGSISVDYAEANTVTSTPDQIYTFLDMILSGIGTPRVTTSTVSGGWTTITTSRA
jgi:hypothetical protein